MGSSLIRTCFISKILQVHTRLRLKASKKKDRLDLWFYRNPPVWHNWEKIPKIGPSNLSDAPVFLVKGNKDYWLFGRYRSKGTKSFVAKEAKLTGFTIPLKTTKYKNQFDAPGSLKPKLGGYHAWQSRDMIHWVHHGSITHKFARWVTTAEQINNKTYIYYDFPNDQDPHLFIDTDLTDGKPGKNMGIAFNDPTDDSDCTVIRDLKGNFHLFYEDWTPINAKLHSWDSPLAGHATSPNGINNLKILEPAVDHRTHPTGEIRQYKHPHWVKENPKRFKA